MTKAVRWVALLAAIALLLQAGWWLFVTVEVARLNAWPVSYGLAHCQRESTPIIGVGCSTSLSPESPIGLYLLLNVVLAVVLVAMTSRSRADRVT